MIAFRALCQGMPMFFEGLKQPTLKQLEPCVRAIFQDLDRDHSGSIDLQEFISFVYKSREIAAMLNPFRGSDQRVFEKNIFFGAVIGGEVSADMARLSKQMGERLEVSASTPKRA